MTTMTTAVQEHDAIAATIQLYIDGAVAGSGDAMVPAFHEDATVFGYVGPDLFAGSIRLLFDWVTDNGPANTLQARISCIEVLGTIASARLEIDDWSGHQFTDLFTLLKVDGSWKIMNKVFHLHE